MHRYFFGTPFFDRQRTKQSSNYSSAVLFGVGSNWHSKRADQAKQTETAPPYSLSCSLAVSPSLSMWSLFASMTVSATLTVLCVRWLFTLWGCESWRKSAERRTDELLGSHELVVKDRTQCHQSVVNADECRHMWETTSPYCEPIILRHLQQFYSKLKQYLNDNYISYCIDILMDDVTTCGRGFVSQP